MSTFTAVTVPTQFVEANGIRFAYRRFGKAGGVPLVFNMHYLGTMDYWDPTVTDGLARDREVILFDNAGVSSSSGEIPTTFEQMGANAAAFSRALWFEQGGYARLLDQIANWAFVDWMLNFREETILSTIKIRQAGFADCIDTHQSFRRQLTRLRDLRIIP
jgi:pimeloyl-ACP methyl ester carboxylesterase